MSEVALGPVANALGSLGVTWDAPGLSGGRPTVVMAFRSVWRKRRFQIRLLFGPQNEEIADAESPLRRVEKTLIDAEFDFIYYLAFKVTKMGLQMTPPHELGKPPFQIYLLFGPQSDKNACSGPGNVPAGDPKAPDLVHAYIDRYIYIYIYM